jgi:hypothetical protein
VRTSILFTEAQVLGFVFESIGNKSEKLQSFTEDNGGVEMNVHDSTIVATNSSFVDLGVLRDPSVELIAPRGNFGNQTSPIVVCTLKTPMNWVSEKHTRLVSAETFKECSKCCCALKENSRGFAPNTRRNGILGKLWEAV